MMERAADKGIYTGLEEHDLNEPDSFPQRYKNQFDFVTCAGLVNNNYMDYRLFE